MSGLDPRLNAVRADLADRRLEGKVESARFAAGEPRRVIAPSAPVRRAPGDGAALDTEALHGEDVLVFEERNGWAWVQLEGDHYVGYVPAAALGERKAAPATHRVIALRTYVFPVADIKVPPVALLSMGSRLCVEREEGRLVRLAGGGFVTARHVAPVGSGSGDPVAVAMRFLGTPYLWGGRTSLGLDCSGLVQLALIACGIPALRDSDMLRRAFGAPVAAAGLDGRGLSRGTLLFWKGHVGIVSRPNRLLHANAFHMEVVEEPLGEAIERIAGAGSPVIAVGRMPRAEAGPDLV